MKGVAIICLGPAGREAAAITSLTAGRTASCFDTGERIFRRPVVKCFIDGADLGETIVKLGWAFEDRWFSGGAYTRPKPPPRRQNVSKTGSCRRLSW